MANQHDPKFSKERADRIVQYLADGNFRKTAAHAVGISYETLRRWITEGLADGAGDKFDFACAARIAEAKAEAEKVAEIRADDPKWWLHRRNKDWSERTEHTGADGAPLVMNFHEPKPQERNGVPHTNGRVTVERR